MLTISEQIGEYKKYYEELRKTFNFIAEENDLAADINSYLVALQETGGFDHAPYIEHMAVNGIEILFAASGSSVDLSLVHTGLDYWNAWQSHASTAELEKFQQQVSSKLLHVVGLIRPAENYIQALAQQALINHLNPFFCDPRHKELFNQVRESIRADVERFAHVNSMTRLESIEQENLRMQVMQSQVINGIEQLKKLGPDINAIQVNMASRKDIQQLIQKLSENELQVSQSFIELLAMSQPTYVGVMKLVEYMEQQQAEKFAEMQAQQTEANYQGLNSTFQFVGQLAGLTGARDLARVAGVAQASVQITRAIGQIAAAGTASLALLNPISAIGMTALSVFSLFQRSPNQTKMIMKQLTQISRQIRTLHRELIQDNKIINERIDFVLKTILEGFEGVQQKLTVPVKRKLNEIQGELSALSKLVRQGFQDVLLRELNDVIGYVFDVKHQIIASEQVDGKAYADKLRLLRDYVLQSSSTALFTGACYGPLLDANLATTRQLLELLSSDHTNQYLNLLGLLALYAKKHLTLPKVNSQDIFHPEIWRIAVEEYINFKLQFAGVHAYDPKAINLQAFKQQAEKCLAFVSALQDESTYQQLAELRQLHTLRLFPSLQALLASIPNHHVEDECKQLMQAMPNQVFPSLACQYDVPPVVQGYDEYVKGTKKYFKKNFSSKLAEFKIVCPKEFLIAAELGIGTFECKCITPEELRKRHHKHHDKFVMKSGAIAGLEVNFVINGVRIPLYRPTQSDKEIRETYLVDIYDHILKNQTEKVYTDDLCLKMQAGIKDYLLNRNKKLAVNITRILLDHPAYHQLLRINSFTVAFLNCAGFPENLIQQFKDASLIVDVTQWLDNYAERGITTTPFPSLALLESTQENPFPPIFAYIQKAGTAGEANHFYESLVSEHVRAGLLRTSELMLLEQCQIDEVTPAIQPGYLSNNRYNVFVDQSRVRHSVAQGATQPSISTTASPSK